VSLAARSGARESPGCWRRRSHLPEASCSRARCSGQAARLASAAQHPVRVQQGGRRSRVQRAEPQLRQPDPSQRVVLQLGFAGGAYQPDRVRAQPAAHKRQHLARGRIQPVHVLGDNQDRRPPGCGRQQLQDRQPHERHRRSHAAAHPQGGQQRIALAAEQPAGSGQHRVQQLVQPGKRHVRLHRDTRAGQHPHPAPGRAPDGQLRQRRLPHARIAEHQQRPAAAETGQQQLHRGDLRVPPEQL